jgi:hypothetical protein
MKKVYAVCCETLIDGGAPGYFIITTCDRLEDAEKVKAKLNTLTTSELDLLGDKDFNDYVFGYNEGACRYMYDNPDVIFISEIRVVESNEVDAHLSYLSTVSEREAEYERIIEAERKEKKEAEEEAEKFAQYLKEQRQKLAQRALDRARDYYMDQLN